MKILAVDDDPIVLELITSAFSRVEMSSVHTASGAADALKKIARADPPYDCFLLDVDMPRMDGIELCKRIRQVPGYVEKPILMLTAKTDSVSIENSFAAGANDYIAKPFNLKDIQNRMRVAERLLETSKTIKRVDPGKIPPRAARGQHDFGLHEKLHLAHVDRVILSFSLGNYLIQLDRKDLDNHQVFCVALDDAASVYHASTSYEFATILSDLADAISDVVTCPHLLMSYEGNGSFLCITCDPNLPGWDKIEKALQRKLDDAGPLLPVEFDTPVAVSVGTPIAPNANRTQRVKKTADRALGRAKMRYATKFAAA